MGGDAEAARSCVKLLDVDPAAARALTHGFHSYAGRMHPSIARGAIDALSKPGETVVDPFCGSGTVLVEAMAAGRAAIGVDASALAVAIARVRIDAAGRGRSGERLVAEAARIAEESSERARKRRAPRGPPWADQEIQRFHAHVLFELLGLRELVFAAKEGPGRLGAAAVPVVDPGEVHEGRSRGAARRRSKRIARGIPSRMLADRAVELARGLGVAGAADAARDAGARGARSGRARAADSRPRRRRWSSRRRPTPGRMTTLRSTRRASSGWGCRRGSSAGFRWARGSRPSATPGRRLARR